MPTTVAPRPVIQKQRKPSILEQLGLVTGVARGVADIATLPTQIRQQKEAGERAQEQLEVQQGQLALEVEKFLEETRAEQRKNVVAAALLNAAGERAQTLRETRGGTGASLLEENPDLASRTLTVGQVTHPGLRESVRTALKEELGVDEIPDNFVLNQRSLEEIFGNIKYAGAIQGLQTLMKGEMATTPQERFFQSLGSHMVFGKETSTVAESLKVLAEQRIANEMIRIDPTSGKVSGFLIENPTEATQYAMQMLGLPEPTVDFQFGNRVYRLTPSIIRDIQSFSIKSAIENANSSEVKAAMLRASASLAAEFGVPIPVAEAMLVGSRMPEGYEQYSAVVKAIQDHKWASLASLATISPGANLILQAAEYAEKLGVPDKNKLSTAREILETINKNAPNSVPKLRSNSMLDLLRGSKVRGVDINRAPTMIDYFNRRYGTQPTTTGGGGESPLGGLIPPDAANTPPIQPNELDVADAALQQELPNIVQFLASKSSSEAEILLQAFAAQGFRTPSGRTVDITPQLLNLLRVETDKVRRTRQPGGAGREF